MQKPLIIVIIIVIAIAIGAYFVIGSTDENENTNVVITNTNTAATELMNGNTNVNADTGYVFPIDEGLVAHWPFDAMERGYVNGTLIGSSDIEITSYLDDGKDATSMYFDNDDRIVLTGDHVKTISDLKQGTIAFWFTYTSTLDTQAIEPLFYLGAADETADSNMFIVEVGHGDTESGGRGGLDPDNKRLYVTWIKDNEEPFLCFDSNVNITEGEWHHLAVVAGPTGNTGYLDGVEMTNRDYNFGTASDTDFLNTIPVADQLMFGYGRTHHEISPNFVSMTGALDDVRIYSRPLVAEEVQELAQ